MSTADTEDSGLEELLRSVLRSGTPLAQGLRTRLLDLCVWLLAEFPDETAARQLMAVLLSLRDHEERVAPGEPPAQVDVSVNGKPDEASDQPASSDGDAGHDIGADDSAAAPDASPAGISAVDSPAPEPEGTDPTVKAAEGLWLLWVELSDNQVAGPYCAAYGAPDAGATADAVRELWQRLFLICLRLPGEQADWIRQQAEAAVADYPGKEQLIPLVPQGLPTEDVAELAELLELAPELAARWPGLIADASWLAWLTWRDEGVRCAHEGTAPRETEPVPFEETRRARFSQHLVNRLKALAGAAAGSSDPLPVVLVDEALRGIVPIPLPQPGSWWTDCLERSKERLESPVYSDTIHVLPLEVNADTWDRNFDTKGAIRIQAAEAAGNHDGNGPAWILRYPAKDPRSLQWKKGRYIAVK
jgi:hypothetical protein